MKPTVEIIGHRGAPRAYTENTLPSFRCALDGGAHALELDVHGTADGVVIVHHDARLSLPHLGRRGPGPAIAAVRYDDLGALGFEHDDAIPTLAEVLRLAGPDHTVYVEVKAPSIEVEVIAVIRASTARCAAHSFDHRVARRVRDLAPDIPVGILLASYLIDPVAALRAADARDCWQQWDLIDAELVERVHDDGRRVIAWTVNDSDAANALARMGVDGLCTDLPNDLARQFA